MTYYKLKLILNNKIDITESYKSLMFCECKTYKAISKKYKNNIQALQTDDAYLIHKLCINLIKYNKVLNIIDGRKIKGVSPLVINMINSGIYLSHLHKLCLYETCDNKLDLRIRLYGEPYHRDNYELILGNVDIKTIKEKLC